MMDCHVLVNEYVNWLKSGIKVADVGGVCEITTPFLDRHRDHLQIYVKHSGDDLILTDNAYTLTDLRLSGCDINTEKRSWILNMALRSFGVQLENDELVVRARPDNFAQKKHNLIQAILTVGDMFVLATPTVANVFREDVERYLDEHEIRFTPDIKLAGKSGIIHSFDFVIPASRSRPERIVEAITNPNKQNTSLLIFSWLDTREMRRAETVAYAILNNKVNRIGRNSLEALHQYGIKGILWTEIHSHIKELAA